MRTNGLDLLALPNQGACKYPITSWETTTHLFCGAPADGTYCTLHAGICFVEPVRKPRYQTIYDKSIVRRAV